jgi:hypothetical protein
VEKPVPLFINGRAQDKEEETIVRTTLISSALVASAILGSVALASTASAMPVAPLQTDQAAKAAQTRWICGWHGRCFWRPNFYAYNYYAGPPRFYHRPWGWRHRFWHRGYW